MSMYAWRAGSYMRGPAWLDTTEEKVVPVACEYCASMAFKKASNCRNCGGPLKWPQVVEQIVEREYRVTEELIDATCCGDDHRVFFRGPKDARIRETVVRLSREEE